MAEGTRERVQPGTYEGAIHNELRANVQEAQNERDAIQNEESGFELAEKIYEEPDEEIIWDVEGILPRATQGWVSGPPKGAKSILTMHLASRLASGKKFLDQYIIPIPRRVLLVQEEDSRKRVRRRLKQLVPQSEKDLWDGRLRVLIEGGLRLDDKEKKEWLVAQIKLHKPDVIIFDVWRWLHAADTNSEKELKPILSFLTALRREHNVTILIVTHDAKPKQGPEGSKQATRITGSWAQWAWAHFGMFLKKVGRAVQVEIEGKDCEDLEFAFRFEGGTGTAPLVLAWEPPKLSEMDRRRKTLADYLMEHAGVWFDLAELATVSGVSRETARNDMQTLTGEGVGFETMEYKEGRATRKRYRYLETA